MIAPLPQITRSHKIPKNLIQFNRIALRRSLSQRPFCPRGQHQRNNNFRPPSPCFWSSPRPSQNYKTLPRLQYLYSTSSTSSPHHQSSSFPAFSPYRLPHCEPHYVFASPRSTSTPTPTQSLDPLSHHEQRAQNARHAQATGLLRQRLRLRRHAH